MKVLQIFILFVAVQSAMAQDRPVPTRHSGGVPIFVVTAEESQSAKKLEVIVPIATVELLQKQADEIFPQRQVVYVTQQVPTGPIAWEAPGRQKVSWYVPPAQDEPMSQVSAVSQPSYLQPNYVSTYRTHYPYGGYRYSYRYPYYGSYSYSYPYYNYSVGYRAGFSWSIGGHSRSSYHWHRHKR